MFVHHTEDDRLQLLNALSDDALSATDIVLQLDWLAAALSATQKPLQNHLPQGPGNLLLFGHFSLDELSLLEVAGAIFASKAFEVPVGIGLPLTKISTLKVGEKGAGKLGAILEPFMDNLIHKNRFEAARALPAFLRAGAGLPQGDAALLQLPPQTSRLLFGLEEKLRRCGLLQTQDKPSRSEGSSVRQDNPFAQAKKSEL